MLEAPISRQGRLVARDPVREGLRFDQDARPEAIEIYVHRLRKKLDGSGATVTTLRGLGYPIDGPPPRPTAGEARCQPAPPGRTVAAALAAGAAGDQCGAVVPGCALDAVNRAYDRSLTASIKAIAERAHSLEGEISVDVRLPAFAEVFGGRVQERIYYAVIGPDSRGGNRLRRPGAPPPGVVADGPPVIVDGHYRDEGVRIGAIASGSNDPALSGDAALIVSRKTTGIPPQAYPRAVPRQPAAVNLPLVAIGTILVTFALSSWPSDRCWSCATIVRRDAEDPRRSPTAAFRPKCAR